MLDMDKDGLITASDFQSDLCWPVEEDVHAMFKEYDTVSMLWLPWNWNQKHVCKLVWSRV